MKVRDYLSEEQEKCLKAIQKINNEQHDKVGWEDHGDLLSMTICSYHFVITLNINHNLFDAEVNLYNSGNDDRIYYEKSDKYEEWYSFIKRKFREVKSELNNIKL